MPWALTHACIACDRWDSFWTCTFLLHCSHSKTSRFALAVQFYSSLPYSVWNRGLITTSFTVKYERNRSIPSVTACNLAQNLLHLAAAYSRRVSSGQVVYESLRTARNDIYLLGGPSGEPRDRSVGLGSKGESRPGCGGFGSNAKSVHMNAFGSSSSAR